MAFGDRGVIATYGEEGADSAQIAAVRWADHETCERLVIDFLTIDGAPASALGPASTELLAEAGIVRISLPLGVTTTAIADTVLDGDLTKRVYVVRNAAGGLFVDLHLNTDTATEVRSFSLTAPARAVVDLRRGTRDAGQILAPPRIGPNVVVLGPSPGPQTYPITVLGYARTFEANVIARLYEQGTSARTVFTTATDYIEAWGSFGMVIDSGPTGEVELFVGEDSAKDGSEIGVRIDLDLN